MTENSGGSPLPDPQDREAGPAAPPGQQPGGRPPGSHGRLRGGPKLAWLITGGLALVAVIVAVTAVIATSHGSGSSASLASSASQAHECAVAVYPFDQDGSITVRSMPANPADAARQEAATFRLAAQKASSDPVLAADLRAIAAATQQETEGLASLTKQQQNQLQRDFKTLSAMCPASAYSGGTPTYSSGTPAPATGGFLASQPPVCAAAISAISTFMGGEAATTGPQATTTAGVLEEEASNMAIEAQKLRQAAQNASSYPPLATDLDAIATDLQNMSVTLASGGAPTATEMSEMAQDTGMLSTLCPSS